MPFLPWSIRTRYTVMSSGGWGTRGSMVRTHTNKRFNSDHRGPFRGILTTSQGGSERISGTKGPRRALAVLARGDRSSRRHEPRTHNPGAGVFLAVTDPVSSRPH